MSSSTSAASTQGATPGLAPATAPAMRPSGHAGPFLLRRWKPKSSRSSGLALSAGLPRVLQSRLDRNPTPNRLTSQMAAGAAHRGCCSSCRRAMEAQHSSASSSDVRTALSNLGQTMDARARPRMYATQKRA
eukprot:scaffold16_cov242-Pinguiococcus_pyrenoidosus.AAC.11